MNYQRIYDELIARGKTRAWTKTCAPVAVEIHHIVPKCIGGTDDKDNLVCLTVREHVLAHVLLAKAQGGKLWRAAFGMTFGNRLENVNSKTIAEIKINSRKIISEKMLGNTNGSYIWSDDRKLIHKEAMSKVGYTPAKHAALSKAWLINTGSKQTVESNIKRSNLMKAIKFVPSKAGDFETCSKAGKANKGIKKSPRSKEHTENHKQALRSKSPHWQYYDELLELWKNNGRPKVAGFTKIALSNNYPNAHYGKMVENFKKEEK